MAQIKRVLQVITARLLTTKLHICSKTIHLTTKHMIAVANYVRRRDPFQK